MNTPFHHRCTSALTHPATVAALIVLLINDLVLKSLWQNPWTTGKISDLAWVVFASPLLAFLLSFVARRRKSAQKAAFAIAYLGLPLLYAAFNTFQPLHDLIIGGLMLASGASDGSPLDPTDSLVIPFGLGAALLIWRRPTAQPNSLRMRLGILMAGVAAFASVATSPPEPLPEETVGVLDDGTLVFRLRFDPPHFSNDGGLTWHMSDEFPDWYTLQNSDRSIDWGGRQAETPRGTYTIEDLLIIRTIDGKREVAYSFQKSDEDNRFQSHIDHGHSHTCCPSSPPINLVYDDRTGNIVILVKTQGVVVEDSSGNWKQVAVNQGYAPTDFSLRNKMEAVLLNNNAWLVAITVSISALALTLAVSHRKINSTEHNPLILFGFVIALLVLPIGALLILIFQFTYPANVITWLVAAVASVLALAASQRLQRKTNLIGRISFDWVTILLVILAIIRLILFPGYEEVIPTSLMGTIRWLDVVTWLPAIVIALALVASHRKTNQTGHKPRIAFGFVIALLVILIELILILIFYNDFSSEYSANVITWLVATVASILALAASQRLQGKANLIGHISFDWVTVLLVILAIIRLILFPGYEEVIPTSLIGTIKSIDVATWLATTAIALSLAASHMKIDPAGHRLRIAFSFVTVLLAILSLIGNAILHSAIGSVGEASIFLILLSILAIAVTCALWLSPSPIISLICLAFSATASVMTVIALFAGGPDWDAIFAISLIAGLIFSAIAIIAFRPTLRQLPLALIALLGMIALFMLSFAIGVVQGFNLDIAKFYALALITLTSVSLGWYLYRHPS